MTFLLAVLTGLLLFGATAGVFASDNCLTRNEQKARAASHAVMPLSRAMRAIRPRGEVVRARLCERSGRLVYLLTVLARDGKVAQASIDAGSGTVIGPR
jgi:uncharacterized membrane protein YkoI